MEETILTKEGFRGMEGGIGYFLSKFPLVDLVPNEEIGGRIIRARSMHLCNDLGIDSRTWDSLLQ